MRLRMGDDCIPMGMSHCYASREFLLCKIVELRLSPYKNTYVRRSRTIFPVE